MLSIPLLLICAIPASIQYICRYFFKLLSRITNEEPLIELNNMHESGNDVINNDDDRVSYINGKIIEIDINDVTEALKKFIHIIATKESDIPILCPKLIERIYTECEADIVNEEIINYIVEEKLWKYMPLLEQSNFKQSEPSRFVHSTNDIDEDTIRDKISKLTIGDLVQRLCDCSNVRVKLANEEYNQKNFDRVYDIPNNKDKVIQKLNEQKLIFSCDSVIEKSDPDSDENVVASSSMTRKSKG